jgi:phosphoesterase RecJ-like protein
MNNKDLNELIKQSQSILILQADNPDGDSLASSLALEEILGDLNKEVLMYCAVDIPKHLRHLNGWDRVEKHIPHKFDLGIIVDCSSRILFENAEKNNELAWLFNKPLVIIDHHDVEQTLDASLIINDIKAVSTGEVIHDLAKKFNWPINKNASNMIAVSILSDSLGLMTQATSPKSIRIIADLVESGVNLPEIEEARRATMRKSVDITKYKGELLQRIEYYNEDQIALIVIPWNEIEKYSSQYNPSMLVLEDMRLTENVKIAIAIKTYPNGRITGKIRSNYGYPIANKLAEHFGAGGHEYASGFKIINGNLDNIKKEIITKCNELINNHLNKNATLQ